MTTNYNEMEETTMTWIYIGMALLGLFLLSSIIRSACAIKHGGEWFFLKETIELTIPKDYDHDNQLALFFRKQSFLFENGHAGWESATYAISHHLTDINFRQMSKNELVPGTTYVVKVIATDSSKVPSEVCVSFLRERGAIFAGAQGLSLLYQVKHSALSWNGHIFSFAGGNAPYEENVIDNLHAEVPYIRGGDGYHPSGFFTQEISCPLSGTYRDARNGYLYPDRFLLFTKQQKEKREAKKGG